MTPLPPTPSPVIRLDLKWTIEGDPMGLTRLFWQYAGGPPSAANLDTIASAGAIYAGTDMITALAGPWVTLETVVATRLDSASGPQGSGGAPQTGTRDGTEPAAGHCLLT